MDKPDEETLKEIMQDVRVQMDRLEAIGSLSVLMAWTPTEEEKQLATVGMVSMPQTGMARMLNHSSFIALAVFMGMHVLRKGFPDEVPDLPDIRSTITIALEAIGEVYGVKIMPMDSTELESMVNNLLKSPTGGADGPSIH